MILSVFSQLSWKHEVSGEQRCCSQRCTSKCSTEPCWKICCQTTKSSPLCDYIQTISHAGIQAEKPIFIKNQVFFGFAFAKHSFYFHHSHPEKSKQNQFAGSEPSKIYQFESFDQPYRLCAHSKCGASWRHPTYCAGCSKVSFPHPRSIGDIFAYMQFSSASTVKLTHPYSIKFTKRYHRFSEHKYSTYRHLQGTCPQGYKHFPLEPVVVCMKKWFKTKKPFLKSKFGKVVCCLDVCATSTSSYSFLQFLYYCFGRFHYLNIFL